MSTDLARTLAAHPRWEWRPGMAVLPDAANPPARMVYRDDTEGHTFAVAERVQMFGHDPGVNAWSDDAYNGEEVPDLDDDATAGVLLGMLAPLGLTCVSPGVTGGWYVEMEGDPLFEARAFGDTLGEAIACALLAVWGPS